MADRDMSKPRSTGSRSRSRALLLQALYQHQLTDHSFENLQRQFHERPEYERVDREYFDALLEDIGKDLEALEERIDRYADRPLAQLDPVERAVLLIGVCELTSRPKIPFRVIINESIDLVKRFGASDGHKYVNAVLDRAATELRADEQSRKS